ncbi:MAG: GNAT family N-acetyltransferase [Chrysiogenetes bacterium]|nr:GNAT family N-acetyltransferase [Chrysiogenetes bacterium]
MSPSPEFHIAPYDPARHLEGCTEALRSAFSHNHWPAWQCASPRMASDFTALLASISDLNFVIEDKATGAARGQVFCMAPAAKGQLARGFWPFAKLGGQFFTGLYLPRMTAIRHLLGIGRGYAGLFKDHPSNDPHFEVVLFAIHESMQGKGWGRRLMDAAVEKFSERGAEKAILMTDSTMSWQFYERYGYKRILTSPMGGAYKVAMDSDHEDAYIYEVDVKEACERIAHTRAARGE